VPVTVIVRLVTTEALWFTVIVTLDVCGVPLEVGTGFTVKVDADVFDGNVPIFSVTAELKPPNGVTVTVYIPLLPRLTTRGLGESEIENHPAEFTTRVAPTVWLSPPLTPWMVNA